MENAFYISTFLHFIEISFSVLILELKGIRKTHFLHFSTFNLSFYILKGYYISKNSINVSKLVITPWITFPFLVLIDLL